MTYVERIRHPSGALDPPRNERRLRRRWLWIAAVVVVAVYVAWRMGWLEKIGMAGAKAESTVRPIANPHGWV